MGMSPLSMRRLVSCMKLLTARSAGHLEPQGHKFCFFVFFNVCHEWLDLYENLQYFHYTGEKVEVPTGNIPNTELTPKSQDWQIPLQKHMYFLCLRLMSTLNTYIQYIASTVHIYLKKKKKNAPLAIILHKYGV